MTIVTYHAPKGDERVVDMQGVSFFDGQSTALDDADHARLIAKLRSNPHFEVQGDAVQADVEDDDTALDDAELRAVHRGAGKWNIVRGDKDKTVKEGLTKADADAFNALSAEDREAYVTE